VGAGGRGRGHAVARAGRPADAAPRGIALHIRAHRGALNADAAAVDDSHLPEAALAGGVEVVAHHGGDLPGRKAVQVENVLDLEDDFLRRWLVLVDLVVVHRALRPQWNSFKNTT
jgi:hypothetical protein